MIPSSRKNLAYSSLRGAYLAPRFYFILFLIIMAVLGLVWRVFDLAILNQHFLRHQGDERVLREVRTPSFRGMIVDRNGFPLAVSTTVYSVWVHPKEFIPLQQDLALLSQLLTMPSKDILKIVKQHLQTKREFVYLKRGLSPDLAHHIKALNIPGTYLQQDYNRYYPEGEIAAHVVGFTNIDDQGQEGLELIYNAWLKGEQGKKWVIKDRLGRVIEDVQMIQEEKPGKDLVLSIDRRIQYLAYRELLLGVRENKAVSGSAIVLDVKTGEILAMVNVPSFNPNNRKGVKSSVFRNRAVTDIFEPGSTIKAFTIASALESGRFKKDAIVDTSPGWMRLGRDLVKDEHGNNGLLSLSQVLQKSSNMGAAKIVLALPPDQLWNMLQRVGFGESTGISFPGEQNGVLIKHHPWGQFILATLSFGYGMSSTALQITRAYSVLANAGLKLPLSLLKLDKPQMGEQVLQPDIAKQMLTLLEVVFDKEDTAGTYHIAGKTGTTKMAGKGGYLKHRYISSFVGMAPLSDPRLIVTVVLHDPQGKNYYGALVSRPIFQKIMQATLRLQGVPPDANGDEVELFSDSR